MKETTNYKFKKPELTDSPPDITVTNPNWDGLDTKLKGIEDAAATHLADDVTDADGVHGLKIEDGTWTAIIKGAITAGINTYSTRTGYYKKIGNRVFFECYINMTVKDDSMAGNFLVDGLPFATKNAQFRRYSITVGRFDSLGYSARKDLLAGLAENSTSIYFVGIVENASQYTIQASDVGSSTIIMLSGNYEIA